MLAHAVVAPKSATRINRFIGFSSGWSGSFAGVVWFCRSPRWSFVKLAPNSRPRIVHICSSTLKQIETLHLVHILFRVTGQSKGLGSLVARGVAAGGAGVCVSK